MIAQIHESHYQNFGVTVSNFMACANFKFVWPIWHSSIIHWVKWVREESSPPHSLRTYVVCSQMKGIWCKLRWWRQRTSSPPLTIAWELTLKGSSGGERACRYSKPLSQVLLLSSSVPSISPSIPHPSGFPPSPTHLLTTIPQRWLPPVWNLMMVLCCHVGRSYGPQALHQGTAGIMVLWSAKTL